MIYGLWVLSILSCEPTSRRAGLSFQLSARARAGSWSRLIGSSAGRSVSRRYQPHEPVVALVRRSSPVPVARREIEVSVRAHPDRPEPALAVGDDLFVDDAPAARSIAAARDCHSAELHPAQRADEEVPPPLGE